MSRHLHKIEGLFHDSLEGMKGSPSENAWQAIETQLDKEDAAIYKRKFIGLKRTAAVVLFLLLGVVIYETRLIHLSGINKIASVRNDARNKIDLPGNIDLATTDHLPKTFQSNDKLIWDKPAEAVNKGSFSNSLSLAPAYSFAVNQHKIDLSRTSNAVTGIEIAPPAIHTDYIDAINLFSIAGEKINTAKHLPFTVNNNLPALVIDDALLKKNTPHWSGHYWTLTAMFSADRSQYALDNDIDDNPAQQIDQKTVIADREHHEPSFTAGLLATYRLSKKWAFQTGLLFSKTQIAIEPQRIYAKEDESGDVLYKYNSSSGYAYILPGFVSSPSIGDSIRALKAKHSLSYASVPVVLQYKWTRKRIAISPGIGFSINTLLGAKLETAVRKARHRETVSINRLSGLRNMYAGLLVNTDLQYNLGRNWSINLMPSFRYAITPINKGHVVSTYPYSFDLGAGVSYRF